jgi:aminoglycoside phosphotransferase (APT) family kinase protein
MSGRGAGRVYQPLSIPVGATAQRPEWGELPRVVCAAVVEALGSAVVQAESQRSGFTPGFASRLWLADGRTAFVKAADRRRSWLVDSYALEAANLELLPAVVPAPRVRHRLEVTDGDTSWLVLIFDDVSGHPPSRPWQREEADRVLAAVRELSVALTPAPPGRQWKGFVADFFPDPAGLFDQVTTRRLVPDIAGRLRELGMSAVESARGDTLVHSDLRDDNVILTDTGEVWVCDWNWPTRGPIWVDTLTVAISMVGDGLDGDRILGESGLVASTDADQIDGLLALLLGYCSTAGFGAPADASPFLRAHQAWYARVIEGWLRHRRSW